MHPVDEGDAMLTLQLSTEDVERLLHMLWVHATPAMGVDQSIHDEIRAQYVDQAAVVQDTYNMVQ